MSNEGIYFNYDWRYKKEDFKFCPRCGSNFKLQDIHIKNQPQLVCHSCRFIFYLDPKLTVVAFILYQDRVLLLKRAEEPGVGLWAFPGGHVERGVDLYNAIKNEVKEETGLDIQVGKIIDTFCFGDTIQLVYKVNALKDQISLNIESKEGKFFKFEDIPWNKLAFSMTREVLKKHFK